jgi:hypothetical protein
MSFSRRTEKADHNKICTVRIAKKCGASHHKKAGHQFIAAGIALYFVKV